MESKKTLKFFDAKAKMRLIQREAYIKYMNSVWDAVVSRTTMGQQRSEVIVYFSTAMYLVYLNPYIYLINLAFMATINWQKEIQPLLKKYKGKKHPLDYNNKYELVVMVVLSAQDSDRHINTIAPDFFKAFPNMKSLSNAEAESLYPFISKVRNFGNKTKWLLELSRTIKEDKHIPTTLEELIALPGIGRKSANVIMREAGVKAEGIIVDLHVVRVAPRLGLAIGTDPRKLEKQMMDVVTPEDWGEVGMAISFLGRETCRPSNPKCPECVMKKVCAFFRATL